MAHKNANRVGKLAAPMNEERACTEALAAYDRQRAAVLEIVLNDLETTAWDCGEFDEDGHSIREDWDVAARALVKGMHAYGWSAKQIDTLLLALMRVRLEHV
jgi:hypothetical protein